MKRTILFAAAVLAAASAFASLPAGVHILLQNNYRAARLKAEKARSAALAEPTQTLTADGLLGSNQRVRIVSSNHVEKAWRRDVVMAGANGEIIGDGGVVGTTAETEAIDEAATNSVRIAQAANASMLASMDYLYANTNRMAEYCVMTAMHVPPETVRSNLTGYVVETTTTNGWDYQWVWYSQTMGLKPIRYVHYSDYSSTADVKAEWLNWTTNGVERVVNGRTWTGCHLCKVERPSFAANEVCLDLPNEQFGRNGMTWGDMVLRMDGKDLYTGFVTNGVTGDVLYFDNGFLTENPEGSEE